MWNSKLINCSLFPGGFAGITTLAQIPATLVLVIFVLIKFFKTCGNDIYGEFLKGCLVIEGLAMILMLIDMAAIYKVILKKIEKIKK